MSYVENIISKTSYGEALLSVVREEEQTEVVKAYFRDFIQCLYPGVSEHWEVGVAFHGRCCETTWLKGATVSNRIVDKMRRQDLSDYQKAEVL